MDNILFSVGVSCLSNDAGLRPSTVPPLKCAPKCCSCVSATRDHVGSWNKMTCFLDHASPSQKVGSSWYINWLAMQNAIRLKYAYACLHYDCTQTMLVEKKSLSACRLRRNWTSWVRPSAPWLRQNPDDSGIWHDMYDVYLHQWSRHLKSVLLFYIIFQHVSWL